MNKAKPLNKISHGKIYDTPTVNENFYEFKVKNTNVRVIFSQNANSATIENALVNIAIRKSD